MPRSPKIFSESPQIRAVSRIQGSKTFLKSEDDINAKEDNVSALDF